MRKREGVDEDEKEGMLYVVSAALVCVGVQCSARNCDNVLRVLNTVK